MPFYDYTCDFCGYQFEKSLPIVKRHDPRSWTCPECHEPECFILQIGTPSFADPVSLSVRRPPAHVEDRLKQIAKDNPNTPMGSGDRKFGHNIT